MRDLNSNLVYKILISVVVNPEVYIIQRKQILAESGYEPINGDR